jgi:hypothetical protein
VRQNFISKEATPSRKIRGASSCEFADRIIVVTKATIHESTRNHIQDFVEAWSRPKATDLRASVSLMIAIH